MIIFRLEKNHPQNAQVKKIMLFHACTHVHTHTHTNLYMLESTLPTYSVLIKSEVTS